MIKKKLILSSTSIVFLITYFFIESLVFKNFLLNMSLNYGLPGIKITGFFSRNSWLCLIASLVFLFSIYNFDLSQSKRNLFFSHASDFFSEKKSLIFIIFFVFISIIFAWGNISNPNFWFDESGQFWLAKGLNHFSAKYSESEGITAVFLNNAKFNLDPGGFTIILHFWTKISEHPFFLRLLPYTFFLFTILILVLIAKEWFPKSGYIILFSGFAFLLYSLLRNYAFELRPYSFEMATAVLSLYVAQISSKISFTKSQSLIFGLLLAIGLTSRYSTVVPVFTASIFYLFYSLKNNTIKKFAICSILFFSPILVASLFNMIMLSNQNLSLNSPDYVKEFVLTHNSAKKIFLHLGSIIIWLPFITLLIIYFVRIKSLKSLKIGTYLLFTCIVTCLYLALSITGKYPLSFRTRWDISIVSIYSISIIPLIYFVLYFYSNLFKISLDNFNQFFQITTIAMAIFYLAFKNSFINKSVNNYEAVYDNFVTCYSEKLVGKILANKNSMPTIKYLFEYGPLLKNKNIYNNVEWIQEKFIVKDLDGRVNLNNVNLNNYSYIIFSHINIGSINYRNLESMGFVNCSKSSSSALMFKNETKL